MPEQSQQPATPTTRISDAALARSIMKKTPGPPAAEANDKLAADELGMIEELQRSSAFRWFFAEFVEKYYQIAFDELRSEHVKPEAMSRTQITYWAMKKIRVGILEREITWRAKLDPNDPVLPSLREKLRNL